MTALKKFLVGITDDCYINIHRNNGSWVNFLQAGYKQNIIEQYMDWIVIECFMNDQKELVIVIQEED